MTNETTRYMSYAEAAKRGAYPDEPAPEDVQQHPKDSIEVYGPQPAVVESTVFAQKPLTITIGGITMELDAAIKQVAHQLSQNKKGEIVATPATSDIRGGGIAPIDPITVDPTTKTEIEKTHKRSSHRRFDLMK